MINWKNKYLNMKLKYINNKKKIIGGNERRNMFIRRARNKENIGIEEIRESIELDCFELSGVEFTDSKKRKLLAVGEIIEQGKHGCVETFVSRDSPHHIWHTHPSCVKYYLSSTDILKPLRYENIQISIVYCHYGFWNITRMGNSYQNTEGYINGINEANRYIYEATGGHFDDERNRIFDLEIINRYINMITQYVENIRVYFYTYE